MIKNKITWSINCHVDFFCNNCYCYQKDTTVKNGKIVRTQIIIPVVWKLN
jgi:hypothetical protein